MIEPLIGRGELAERVGSLAAELSRELDAKQPPVLVGVLKGCTMFLADLVRALEIDVVVDFMSISSYAPGSGVVRIVKDLDVDIVGRDVVVVEDIVDTGLTLHYLRRNLHARRAGSVRAISLLDRAVRRIVPVELEHRCFEIPDVFVVGYGMDWHGRYRNLRDIFSLGESANPTPPPARWP